MIEIIQIALLVGIIILIWQSRDTTKRLIGSSKPDQIILDSCTLIDGRIIDIAKSGFISGTLVIPEFIVRELQLLADGADNTKRERARFGLDAIKTLQELSLNVSISTIDFKDLRTTDDKLLRLAEKLQAKLCTTDYNLNKVAAIQGIIVLNVNELSNAVRAVVLPGEQKEIVIIQKGSGKEQGVGYLDDGSMVVVSDASSLVGKRVKVEITRMLQSDAGKMLFAKLVGQTNTRRKQNNTRRSQK